MSEYFLAIDAGGSSTRALIFDAEGHGVGYGTAGPANPVSVGPEGTITAVSAAVGIAISSAAPLPINITSGTIALAGSTQLKNPKLIEESLYQIGLSGPLRFCSDLDALYWSAGLYMEGYGLVAGTGAGAIAVKEGKTVRVVDGAGWLVGDRGSGFWCGQKVAQAAIHDIDGSGPRTQLTDAISRHFDIPTGHPDHREALLKAIYMQHPVALAQLTYPLFALMDDPVADAIIAQAQEALLQTLKAVLQPGLNGPLVVGGGIAARLPQFQDMACEALGQFQSSPQIYLVQSGLAGAAYIEWKTNFPNISAKDMADAHASIVRYVKEIE